MVGLLERFFGSKKTERPRKMDAQDTEVVVKTAQDIAAAFGDVLASPGGMIRDIEELPFTKEQIKTALILLLKLTNDSQTLEGLKTAYISLGAFQKIDREQRQALREWDGILGGGKETSISPEAMVRIGGKVMPIQNTAAAETSALQRELEAQGLW